LLANINCVGFAGALAPTPFVTND